MKPITDGHIYELDNGTRIEFVHRDSTGRMVTEGTTTTGEWLDLITHRIASLQFEHPCDENIKTIAHLKMALKHQKDRNVRQIDEAKR